MKTFFFNFCILITLISEGIRPEIEYTLHMLIRLEDNSKFVNGYYYYTHFTDEKRGNKLPKVCTFLTSGHLTPSSISLSSSAAEVACV